MTQNCAPKVIYLARRNPALSRDEFPARWRQHSLLAGSMPSIRPGFSQVAQCLNLYDRSFVPRAALDYDGVNLLTFNDAERVTAVWQSDEVHNLVLPDELATFDRYVRQFSLTAEEHLVGQGPMQPFCLIVFLKRDRKLSLDEFGHGIVEAHRKTGQGGRRAVVNLVTDRQPDYNFDAVTELWFASAEEAAEVTQSQDYAESYLKGRWEICDEWRTLTMMTRINYARPPID